MRGKARIFVINPETKEIEEEHTFEVTYEEYREKLEQFKNNYPDKQIGGEWSIISG